MVKRILALCDKEENYVSHMADYLEKKQYLPFSVHAFTDTGLLEQFMEMNKVELLLIGESAYSEGISECGAEHVLILNESGNQAGEGIENINKYQSSENIFKAVMEKYANHMEGNVLPVALGNKMKMLGIYTPIGRCLQTTFSLCMGQILSKKHKTLYLNFEAYSGFQYMTDQSCQADITDMLYYFGCEKEKLAYRTDSMVQSVGGLDYISPVMSYKDLEQVTGERWLELFREIEKMTDYEYLILDLSEQMRGLFEVLRNCFKVFTIIREDGLSEAKIRQYEAILQTFHYEDIAMKTKKWCLPVFHRLPAGFEQLTHGELADYVRKIIEKEIYE